MRRSSTARRRRFVTNYLLNKRLQLRYIAVVTLLSAALASVLGYMVWNQERSGSASMVSAASDYGDDVEADVFDALMATDTQLVREMVLAGLGIVVVLVVCLLVMTHTVAGPLHKVAMYFDEMAHGRLSDVYPLRRFDQLRDFYDQFQAMHDALRERQQHELAVLGAFIDACEAAELAGPDEFSHRLAEAKAHHARRVAQVTTRWSM